ncbi:metalloprotease TldD [Crenobacter caeni]|uniref:Metalloprotease TldD n=1 Tax=Crenobacter caeni TaxID=2705474 RepID=A0A6B2KQ41_9NEIS|nr:metalloprotease TldD [Crenobacter caeni]NDV12362.1 metalloprotease TldD [Crenobacter caeni]
MNPQHEQLALELMLAPGSVDEAVLEATFARLSAPGVDYADLYFQRTRNEGWSLEEGIVKAGSFSIDQGVGVRAVSGDKTAFAYADEISAASLARAADTVRAIGHGGGVLNVGAPKPTRGSVLYPASDPGAALDAAAKVDLLHRIEKIARAMDSRIIQVMASVAAEYDVVYVARADGVRAADVRPLTRVSVMVIVEENGRREQAGAGGGGRFDLTYFTDEVVTGYVERAVREATTNLRAQAAPAGQMTVVLGAGWPGVLLHEAIGHGLEGDFNRKGTSAFAGRIGERVAAPGVTIVDDGTLQGRRGSLSVDDEGELTRCTTLIEDGILKGYMQDAMNARLMKMAPTGNGRRESYAHIPMPRMTNTYMHAGAHDPEEIIASVKDGLYAVNFGGGQVDITSGKFVFSASEAWKIENGKLVYPVKGATLIGNGPEVLKYVGMIGNDLALDTGVGVCGKEGQSVPVGVGQPTLRIDGGLTVGGTGG